MTENMSDNTPLTIDRGAFEVSDYGRLRIEMPPKPTATDDDVDAQLFSYVASAPAGSSIKSIGDLNDAWVKENFSPLDTIADLRQSIKDQLTKDMNEAYRSYEYTQCAEELVSRLQGDIPEQVVFSHMEEVRQRNEAAMRASGHSKAVYLEGRGLSEEDYERMVREESEHDIALNIVLDKMIEHEGIVVTDDEIADYLVCDDPEAFLADLREKDMVEQARVAAIRVKAMRKIVETAEKF